LFRPGSPSLNLVPFLIAATQTTAMRNTFEVIRGNVQSEGKPGDAASRA
jgi:hypothetical protein